jgi:aminoglycoside phosphotransferase (APT) family kinase protein
VALRRSWAVALADFVADLHQSAPTNAPVNRYRGVPLATRAATVPLRLGEHPSSDRLLPVWESALTAAPWEEAPVWLHGDLHPANLVVRRRRIAAVIDFIDLTSGDPATDLAAAWLTFDAEGRCDFRDRLDARRAYVPATWERARGWALALAAAMAERADPVMAACAADTFEEVLSDVP